MKNKLRQFYSILLNKHTNAFIAGALAVVIALAILAGGLLMSLFSVHGLKDAVYRAMLMVVDPGFLAVDSGFWVGLISLLLVVFGIVVFLGGAIGYISSVLSSFMNSVRRGSKKVFLCNHMLILNWNPRVLDIFTEECYRGRTRNILVLVKDNMADIHRQIQERRSRLKQAGEDYHHVNCFVRQGDLFSAAGLLDAGVERADSILVLDDEDTRCGAHDLASMTPIKILMLLAKMNLQKGQSILVESVDGWTKGLVEDIELESADAILAIPTNELLGKMLAQISMMPELNLVYGEVMSHRGSEFYSLPLSGEAIAGVGDFMDSHNHAIPLDVMDVSGECYLVAMGEEEASLARRAARPPDIIPLQINRDGSQPKRNLVIIGKNSKQNYLFDCYAEYIAEHGEESLSIDRISTEEGLEMVRDKKYISRHPIQYDYDQESIQLHLRRILQEKRVDTILLLSNDMDGEHSPDTEVLVDLIHVKRTLLDIGYEPELVVEILDLRHLDIARGYGIKSIVFSNQYISRLITQFGDSPSLYGFFADLFTYDTDREEVEAGRFRSKEIYVRRVDEVFKALPPAMSQRSLVASVYRASPPENPMMVLGSIQGSSGEMTLFGGDMDTRQIALVPGDKLVVYCRH